MTEIAVREPEPPKQKNKKKRLLIIIVALAVLILAGLLLRHFLSGGQGPGEAGMDEAEYVEVASRNYFNGVIEPQRTWDIQKDAVREINQIYVTVGQSVSPGQNLFSYKTDELAMQLKQAQLELNGIKNEIDGYGAQISELTGQRAAAPAEQQLEYTIQIQEMQNARGQAELNLQMKQMEIDNLQKSIDNAVVTSTMEGVVKQINSNSADPSQPFMTILAAGAYQVKGTVDEMNVWTLYEGMPVNIRSRVDEDQVWSGTITKIDTENTVSSAQDMYYGDYGGTSENQATKYNFYVALNTDEQLLLGQHVYIEPVYDEVPQDAGDLDDTADTAAEDQAGASEEDLPAESQDQVQE
ncbi:MAG: efflux RND transporter periplasmic adaptor subunit [Firmicutes bacterium]|nr:efflux RND transporter periplasmic adaptor subunit [Bacillota bacterium]